ncbi:MAG: NAD-dependent epimerase/dehydratase family protein [Treponema sp.]|jgi:nucleoside-diphosphate-sugar epimerase|nr:NAD-dependent epimerase/dehydratase family protein [Treponema sp.]
MNITIIGGSGFVGTRLTALLRQKDISLRNIDRQNSHFYPEITTIADVRSGESLKPLLRGQDCVVLLAALYQDDVSPASLYYDVNVEGTRNVLDAMDYCGVKKIIFTSSVSVYGLNKENPDENYPVDPFGHYGKSKWQAEELLRIWYQKDPQNRALYILRPTVIFGERNRGNVYRLLKQIASGKFLMIGEGTNIKSISYVGNVAAFIRYLIENELQGYKLFNYSDKPDLTMNQLIAIAEESLGKMVPSIRIPYIAGLLGGYCFDLVSKLTKKKFSISSVRVRKVCATTQYDAKKAHSSGFKPPFSLSDALDKTMKYEFIIKKSDDLVFISE